jgi:hypothetical protein
MDIRDLAEIQRQELIQTEVSKRIMKYQQGRQMAIRDPGYLMIIRIRSQNRFDKQYSGIATNTLGSGGKFAYQTQCLIFQSPGRMVHESGNLASKALSQYSRLKER